MTVSYRKKRIEVGLPLVAINAESAREKSIRHGHPSTFHLWWARGVRNRLNPDTYQPSSATGMTFRPANREERKAFLLQVLAERAKDGASLGELLALMPELNRRQLQSLLAELQADTKVHSVGRTKAARWFVGKEPS